ncbi:MAG: hypothetical protein MUP36_00715, partial [Demequinaceae bacterium]|nr:hypothetical protein [Demequinaceae bacterium]
MTRQAKGGSDEVGTTDASPGRHRWGRGAMAGVGAGALGLAAIAAVAFWPEDEPSLSPGPSASVSPSPTTTASEPRDLPWGESIPWDEVGPGWTLLAYDAAKETTEWGEIWNLAGDELWLLAPDGTRYFGADISGLGATYIEAWMGQEAWLYGATEYQGESSTGTLWNVDLAEGTVSVVAENSPSRGSPEPTAIEGVYLSRGGCCGCTETSARYADGTSLLLNDGCGESSLSPDGLTLAYVSESEVDGEYYTTFMVTDLEGNSTSVAVSPM